MYRKIVVACRSVVLVSLFAIAALLSSCSDRKDDSLITGENPVTPQPPTQPYEGSGILLEISLDTDDALRVFPGEITSREIYVQVAAPEVNFDLEVQSSFQGVTITDINSRYSLRIDSTSLADGTSVPVTIVATNKKNEERSIVDLVVEVLEPTLVGSGSVTNGVSVIGTIDGEYAIEFDLAELTESIGVEVYELQTDSGRRLQLVFDRDVSMLSGTFRVTSNTLESQFDVELSADPPIRTVISGDVKTASLNNDYPIRQRLLANPGYYAQGYRLDLSKFSLNSIPLSCRPSSNAGPLSTAICIDLIDNASELWGSRTLAELLSARSALNAEAIEPVLFIHGYKPLNEVGGGEDTWNDFPHLITQIGVPGLELEPFEFRWRSNASFRTIAPELAAAIDSIYELTGRPVRVIAHSMGGVLIRAVLQEISPNQVNTGFDQAMVASVLTLGTPHSGIFRDATTLGSITFPDGQDSWTFGRCGQISCFQLGQEVDFNDLAFAELLDLGSIGEIASLLVTTRSRLVQESEVPIIVGIGLKREGDLNSRYDDGDELISFEGQRFLPGLQSQLLNCQDLLLPVREVVLGAFDENGYDDNARPGSAVRNNARGYSHSNAITSDPDNNIEFAEPYVDCAEFNGACEHDALRLFASIVGSRKPFLTARDEHFCEDRADPPSPIDPTDPTEPPSPIDPTDPTEPPSPTDPTDPTEPPSPIDPTDPTEPPSPIDPTDPSEPSELLLTSKYAKFFEGDPGIENDGKLVDATDTELLAANITSAPKIKFGHLIRRDPRNANGSTDFSGGGITITLVTESDSGNGFNRLSHEFGYLGTDCLIQLWADGNVGFSDLAHHYTDWYLNEVTDDVADNDSLSSTGFWTINPSGCSRADVTQMFYNGSEFFAPRRDGVKVDAVILDAGRVDRF